VSTMKLEEALDKWSGYYDGVEEAMPPAFRVIVAAATRWLDFPTDEQVEAAAKAAHDWSQASIGLVGIWDESTYRDQWREQARAALEAVTMIGDNQGDNQ
jgi:hypothetical protein